MQLPQRVVVKFIVDLIQASAKLLNIVTSCSLVATIWLARWAKDLTDPLALQSSALPIHLIMFLVVISLTKCHFDFIEESTRCKDIRRRVKLQLLLQRYRERETGHAYRLLIPCNQGLYYLSQPSYGNDTISCIIGSYPSKEYMEACGIILIFATYLKNQCDHVITINCIIFLLWI